LPPHKAIALGICLLASGYVYAERLANEHFTTDRGLISDHINVLTPDSRGFVWIGTNEGVSRFDGASFENYTKRDGLPDNRVTGIAEDRGGGIWIATEGGLARVTANEARIRIAGARQPINAVVLGGDGAIWAAAGTSLLRIDPNAAASGPRVVVTLPPAAEILSLAAGPQGDVWMATAFGLWRRTPAGRITHFSLGASRASSDDQELVRHVAVTPDGIVWFARAGILAFRPDDGSDPRPLGARVKAGDVITPDRPFRLPRRAGDVVLYDVAKAGEDIAGGPVVSATGTVWTATPFGLLRIVGDRLSVLGEESGITFDELRAIAIDRNGVVWLGTLGEGIIRLHPEGLVSYSTADGLLHKRVVQTFELQDGTLVVASGGGRALQFHDGSRFRGVLQNVRVKTWGWGWNQIVSADREGDVWIGSGDGLLRYRNARTFADLVAREPIRYSERDGLSGNAVFRVWEDSRGDIWIGSFGKTTLTRYDRATGRFIRYAPREGIPLNAPSAFAEDRRGNVLVGWYEGGFSRIAKDGSARFFGAREGVPPGFTHALLVDSHDRLWIASGGGGVGVVEHIDREPFQCRRLTRQDGLSSDTARALVEASDGAIWIGSDRGIDRIARSGAITHYGRDDGLTNVLVTNAFRDRAGVLWFGTVDGLVSAPMPPSPPSEPEKTLITDVIIDGVSVAARPFGSDAIGGLDLGTATRSVEFRFVAPALQQKRAVRYAFRLDGVEQTWTETADRVVRFEHLPARELRFEVRAVSAGAAPSQIARVAFRIAPPLWRRSWFVLSFCGALLTLLVVVYRARVAHLLAIERMRTRIAMDLHDDLGSSLSRMSILSELARRQVEGSEAAGILETIGSSARTLIEALGDSIWAIDPRTDTVDSVVTRSRDQVREILDAAGIEIRFDVPEGAGGVHLPPDVRRHVYLILKESLNNVARHSRAREVVVSIAVRRDRLSIDVVDDGRGFDVTRVPAEENGGGGRGLVSLRARAERLGGTLVIDSAPGRGTRLHLEIAAGA